MAPFEGGVTKQMHLKRTNLAALTTGGTLVKQGFFQRASAGAIHVSGVLIKQGFFSRTIGGSFRTSGTVSVQTLSRLVEGAIYFSSTLSKYLFAQRSVTGNLRLSSTATQKRRLLKVVDGARIHFSGAAVPGARFIVKYVSGIFSLVGYGVEFEDTADVEFLDTADAEFLEYRSAGVVGWQLFLRRKLAGVLGFAGAISVVSGVTIERSVAGGLRFAASTLRILVMNKAVSGQMSWSSPMFEFVDDDQFEFETDDDFEFVQEPGVSAGIVDWKVIFKRAAAGAIHASGAGTRTAARFFRTITGSLRFKASVTQIFPFALILQSALRVTSSISKILMAKRTLGGGLTLTSATSKKGFFYRSLAGSFRYVGSVSYIGWIGKGPIGVLTITSSLARKLFARRTVSADLTLTSTSARTYTRRIRAVVGNLRFTAQGVKRIAGLYFRKGLNKFGFGPKED